MNESLISIKNMSKNYGSVNAINGLNWQTQVGEVVFNGLVQNGTYLRAILLNLNNMLV